MERNKTKCPFIIKKSRIEGRGAFATRLIAKGELICFMREKEISVSQLKRLYTRGRERYSDPLQVRESRYVDLDKPYVLINHSCSPDATILTGRRLTAVKDIKPEEEIVYDYSFTEWSNDRVWKGWKDWTIPCHCGSSHCRGSIEEFQFLPQGVQKRAIRQKLVPNYIVRKYRSRRD